MVKQEEARKKQEKIDLLIESKAESLGLQNVFSKQKKTKWKRMHWVITSNITNNLDSKKNKNV